MLLLAARCVSPQRELLSYVTWMSWFFRRLHEDAAPSVKLRLMDYALGAGIICAWGLKRQIMVVSQALQKKNIFLGVEPITLLTSVD